MKHTMKKVFLLALFVLVLTALFVVGANAATLDDAEADDVSAAVARVGEDAYYTTFAKAFTAANALENGGTITLLSDITITDLDATFTVSKPIVIDGKKDDNNCYEFNAATSAAVNLFTSVADFTLRNIYFDCTFPEGERYIAYGSGKKCLLRIVR